jgi:hypothetical protein
MRLGGFVVGVAVGGAMVCAGRTVRAEPAIVAVDVQDSREDPRDARRALRVASDDEPCRRAEEACADQARAYDPYETRTRAAVRVALGGAVATAGHAAAPGLDVGLELGRGTVGARIGAAWMRATDGSGDGDALAPGLSQYLVEIFVDGHPRGPWHPIAAIGIGVAHAGGNAGIGTARLGVAYALPVEDADVRVAISVLGALPGPAESDAAALRGYAMGVASMSVGF